MADLATKVDFAFVPDAVSFFTDVAKVLKPSGRLLLAEPRGHVSEAKFAMMLHEAATVGLRVAHLQAIFQSRAALLVPA